MRYIIDSGDILDAIQGMDCPDDGECRTRAEMDDKHPKDCLQCHLQNGTVGEEQGWISVEDGLPEHTYAVLVSNYVNCGGVMRTIVEVGYFNCEGRWVNRNDCYFTNVTHWMPLPEPPKGRN